MTNQDNFHGNVSFFEAPLNNVTLPNPVSCDDVFDNKDDFGHIVEDVLEGYNSNVDMTDLSQTPNNISQSPKGSNEGSANAHKCLHPLCAQMCNQIQNQDEYLRLSRKNHKKLMKNKRVKCPKKTWEIK